MFLPEKREYPKGEGVRTNTPAMISNSSVFSKLNPPPLIQEEEFI
jgi:hypothetical protein